MSQSSSNSRYNDAVSEFFGGLGNACDHLLRAYPSQLSACPATTAVIGYNVESDGANQTTLATVIGQIQTQSGCDVWGFSEVMQQWEQPFRQAAATASGANFQSVLGTTGGSDRMLILFNSDRLQQIGPPQELHRINPLERVRAPLVVRLRIIATGQDFLFMVNHLYRGRDHSVAAWSVPSSAIQ